MNLPKNEPQEKKKINKNFVDCPFSSDHILKFLQLPQALSEHFGDHETVKFSKTTLPFYSHTQIKTISGPCLKFWSEKGVNPRIFSNLYPCKISLDDDIWPSTEHYFQGYKYSKGDRIFMNELSTYDCAFYGKRKLIFREEHIRKIEDIKKMLLPYPIKQNGSEYKVGDRAEPKITMSIKEWDSIKLGVMYKALVSKFSQHEDLKKQLLATENSWLIEHTQNDRQWGDGADGKGNNFLGKLLIIIRHKIKNNLNFSSRGNLEIYSEFFDEIMSNLVVY